MTRWMMDHPWMFFFLCLAVLQTLSLAVETLGKKR